MATSCSSFLKIKKTTGIELDPVLSYLKTTYPDKSWIQSDFNLKFESDFDIVICSDVIEHLADPNKLIQFINSLNFSFCIFSTPNRTELLKNNLSPLNGPPLNKAHVREWTSEEFENYLCGTFNIVDKKEVKAECSQILVVSKK